MAPPGTSISQPGCPSQAASRESQAHAEPSSTSAPVSTQEPGNAGAAESIRDTRTHLRPPPSFVASPRRTARRHVHAHGRPETPGPLYEGAAVRGGRCTRGPLYEGAAVRGGLRAGPNRMIRATRPGGPEARGGGGGGGAYTGRRGEPGWGARREAGEAAWDVASRWRSMPSRRRK